MNRTDLREVGLLCICQDNCVYLCFSLRPSFLNEVSIGSITLVSQQFKCANSTNFAFLLFSRSNSWGPIPLSPPRIRISTLLPDRQGYKRSPNAAAPQYLQPSAAKNKLHIMHEKENIVALPNSKCQDYVENCHKLTSTPSVGWVQRAELLLSQPSVHFFLWLPGIITIALFVFMK